jgi:hypothetical protein
MRRLSWPTPNILWSGQVSKGSQDALSRLSPSRGILTELKEPCGALPWSGGLSVVRLFNK